MVGTKKLGSVSIPLKCLSLLRGQRSPLLLLSRVVCDHEILGCDLIIIIIRQRFILEDLTVKLILINVTKRQLLSQKEQKNATFSADTLFSPATSIRASLLVHS